MRNDVKDVTAEIMWNAIGEQRRYLKPTKKKKTNWALEVLLPATVCMVVAFQVFKGMDKLIGIFI